MTSVSIHNNNRVDISKRRVVFLLLRIYAGSTSKENLISLRKILRRESLKRSKKQSIVVILRSLRRIKLLVKTGSADLKINLIHLLQIEMNFLLAKCF